MIQVKVQKTVFCGWLPLFYYNIKLSQMHIAHRHTQPIVHKIWHSVNTSDFLTDSASGSSWCDSKSPSSSTPFKKSMSDCKNNKQHVAWSSSNQWYKQTSLSRAYISATDYHVSFLAVWRNHKESFNNSLAPQNNQLVLSTCPSNKHQFLTDNKTKPHVLKPPAQ